MKIFILSIQLLILFNTVSFSQSSTPYDYSDQIIEKSSVKVSFNNDFFDPRSIAIDQNHFIITDASNNPSFQVFKIKTQTSMEYLLSRGKEGRGPGNFLDPWTIIQVQNNILFYIYDVGTRTLTAYDQNFNLLPQNSITLKTSGFPIDIFILGNQFIVTGITIGCRLEKLDSNGKKTDCIGKQPDLDLPRVVSKTSIAARWRANSILSPDSSRIAFFYRYAAYAALSSINGNLITEIKDSDFGIPKTKVSSGKAISTKEGIKGYLSVTADQKYIYALYSGENYRSPTSSYGKFIHKFDWNLNLVSIYKLDHSSFFIETDENGGIYSIQHNPNVSVRYIRI